MSESKKDLSRKEKAEAFKEKAKEGNKPEKTHIIPLTSWEATDNLDLRGDLLEAFEQQLVNQFQAIKQAEHAIAEAGKAFQKGAHIMQMIMQDNIKKEKIKLTYSWNDGTDATSEEVADYEKKMNEIRELQRKQFQDYFDQKKKEENAEKTGLVNPDGSPIGTTQNLDGEDKIEEVGVNTESDGIFETGVRDSQQAADSEA